MQLLLNIPKVAFILVFSFCWIIKCRGCWVLSVRVRIVENWCACPWKWGQPAELRSHFSRKQPACLSLPGALGVLRDQTDKRWLIGSRSHSVSFQPCLGSYYWKFSYFLLSPFTRSALKPHVPLHPSPHLFNPARVFFPLSKQIWVGSFN